ncbi:MAG: type II toxin-antitoxin system VapC family toxin [Bryobacteraceae bacterium]
MKLLLDTHIWLWSLIEPDRLSRRVSKAIDDPSNELWLSPISVWEVVLLCSKGRVSVGGPPDKWVKNALKTLSILEAPFTHEIALETLRFEFPHRDPADRFLVATARVLDLVLVTADRNLIGAKHCKVLANV